ncbi:hypothetical protein H6F89_30685 [Cyanobacteria bacterium FACHB-63]|nr:hypothetical protein [Cyanobacteria bacterium FACHB-63]
MQQKFRVCFAKLFWNGSLLELACALQLAITSLHGYVFALIALVQLPAVSQSLRSAKNIPLDNIYHENENLPNGADIFPRLGKIAGNDREQTNCRSSPWGRVVSRFSGNSSIHIDDRRVDRNGESWFYNREHVPV